MKKLLIVLLALPLIGFGQTAEDYYKKAKDYYENGKHQLAIDNVTEAIRINPDLAEAYGNRGLAKAKSGQSSCSDYKRACNLGLEECCKWYKEDNCR